MRIVPAEIVFHKFIELAQPNYCHLIFLGACLWFYFYFSVPFIIYCWHTGQSHALKKNTDNLFNLEAHL